MKKYQTCVTDTVADKFAAFCVERGQTPYDVLSQFIHKVAGIERKKRVVAPALQADVSAGVVNRCKCSLGIITEDDGKYCSCGKQNLTW